MSRWGWAWESSTIPVQGVRQARKRVAFAFLGTRWVVQVIGCPMERNGWQDVVRKGNLWLALVFLSLSCTTPPTRSLQTARRAVQGAHRMGAKEYAPERLKEAEEALQRAIDVMATQRKRPPFLRKYEQAWSALTAALEAASLAKREAVAYRDTVHREAEAEIERAGGAIQQVRRQTAELPLDRQNRMRIMHAEIALSEARSAVLAEDFLLARAKAREARERAMEVQHRSDTTLKSYLTPYALAQWRRWAAETISWSDQQNTYALIIDKVRRRCDLYFDGRLQSSYPADLGYGPLGDKVMRGDAVTPEGKYQVVAKRDIGDSPYRRSLVLNYPTREDSIRFRRAKAQGLLPGRAVLGGQIEIHGGGVRGTNWTFGCIALRDADIDQVFRRTRAGTPVTIVGGYRD